MTTFWLPNDPLSAAAARRLFDDLPRTRGVDDVCFFARFVASSLIANAVLYAGLPPDCLIRARAEEDEYLVRVEIADGGHGFDPLRTMRRVSERDTGLGLRLLDALADRWGYRREADEMTIWFEFDLISGIRPWNGRDRVGAAPRAIHDHSVRLDATFAGRLRGDTAEPLY